MTPVRKQPVPIATFRTSRPDAWNVPRQSADISTRGPIQSMPVERSSVFDLLRHGMPGGLMMLLLIVIATIALVAIGGMK